MYIRATFSDVLTKSLFYKIKIFPASCENELVKQIAARYEEGCENVAANGVQGNRRLSRIRSRRVLDVVCYGEPLDVCRG